MAGIEPTGAQRRGEAWYGSNDVASFIHRAFTKAMGYDDAVRTAIRKAAQTVRNIDWFEVKEIRGQVADGDIGYVQVTVKLGFTLE